MAKSKSRYVCQQCGATSVKWMGRCPQCQNWDTYVEEVTYDKPSSAGKERKSMEEPVLLSDIPMDGEIRIQLGEPEIDRVLGGGLVPGSLILMSGEPGTGKSTLLLQLARNKNLNILYISGEESVSQIKSRANRIGIEGGACHILAETDLHHITEAIQKIDSGLVIIDSIQTIYNKELESVPGSVSQIRECTYQLQQLAKQAGIAIILVGHVTKDGEIAGPKLMEHIVDVVLHLEGDRQHQFRLLRGIKNRYGSTMEIGIYEMRENGMQSVENPSAWLIPADHTYSTSGSVVSLVCEGYRPFLIETQALVTPAVYGTAQRSSAGFDTRRLHLMLAVLEKRCGFVFGNQDVFLNVAGGLKVTEPAIDLGVCVALVSSRQDIAVSREVCFTGEVGLNGEIRPVPLLEKRILEASRLGYKRVIAPYNGKDLRIRGTEIQTVRWLHEVFEIVFG